MGEFTSTSSPVRVAIVDDDVGYAQALAELVSMSSQFTVVGVADDVRSGCDVMRQTAADLGLVDVNMPSGGGRAVVEAVREWASPPVLILMSAMERPRDLDDALPFLLKDGLDVTDLVALWHRQKR